MKFAALFSIILFLLSGCNTPVSDIESETGDISLTLEMNGQFKTRSTPDVGTAIHSVNRVLVIPFQKKDMNGADNDSTNFIPSWNLIRQYDLSSFPATSLNVSLVKTITYKLMVIGFNSNDYDYTQPNASTNRFDLNAQPANVTLANFRLYPKSPNMIPEFFTCICYAQNGSGNPVTAFTPAEGTELTITGTLQRVISGLGVYLTQIPAFVTSVTLSAENLVKSSRLLDHQPDQVQVSGDGASRVIRQLTPQAGTIRFNEFLLPTGTTAKTTLYLDVTYDTRTTRYTITVPDNANVSVSNQIIFQPNEAVQIEGEFSKTGISFQLNYNINLDDNQWDGLQ